MKQLYLNIFFQFVAIIVVIKILFFEETNFYALSFFYTKNLIIIFTIAILAKFLLTFLFYSLLNMITSKKNNFFDVSIYFLQGGIINQLLPGVGFIYKYYKLKFLSSVNLAQFSAAQSLFTLGVFASYILLAIFFGFIAISFSPVNTLIAALIFFFLTVIAISMRRKLYNYTISKLLRINKISSFINDLRVVKKLLKKNFTYILIVFFGFLLLANLMIFNFYTSLNIFGTDISFLSTSYIWISSSIASIISLINFFGLFEFIITFSSSIIVPDLNDMFLFALIFRLINISSTFLIVFLFSLRYLPDKIRNLLNFVK